MSTKDMTKLSSYWKVPFRQVYCETFRVWLAEVIHCHVVLKLNPPNLPSIGEPA